MKEIAGHVVGESKLEVEGAGEKARGKVQTWVGQAQDKIGAAIKR